MSEERQKLRPKTRKDPAEAGGLIVVSPPGRGRATL